MNENIGSYEEIARQMVRHENELMNHRVTWLMSFEGLLFTALGFAWDKADARPLVYVFCGIGALVPASTWWVLDGAQSALSALREWWQKHQPVPYEGPGVVGFWHDSRAVTWMLPWRVFPVLFAVAWVAVGVINFQRPAPTGVNLTTLSAQQAGATGTPSRSMAAPTNAPANPSPAPVPKDSGLPLANPQAVPTPPTEKKNP